LIFLKGFGDDAAKAAGTAAVHAFDLPFFRSDH
jgi:hypothetical protein